LIGARHTGHVDQALRAEQVKLPDDVLEQLEKL